MIITEQFSLGDAEIFSRCEYSGWTSLVSPQTSIVPLCVPSEKEIQGKMQVSFTKKIFFTPQTII